MKNIKKYSCILLATAVVVGGVTSATFDFSTLPGADKIKDGAIIQASDILSLSNALSELDQRTNGTAPSADTDLVNKGFLDTQIANNPGPQGATGGTGATGPQGPKGESGVVEPPAGGDGNYNQTWRFTTLNNIFITKTLYNGNLGGIDGANAKCELEFPGTKFANIKPSLIGRLQTWGPNTEGKIQLFNEKNQSHTWINYTDDNCNNWTDQTGNYNGFEPRFVFSYEYDDNYLVHQDLELDTDYPDVAGCYFQKHLLCVPE